MKFNPTSGAALLGVCLFSILAGPGRAASPDRRATMTLATLLARHLQATVVSRDALNDKTPTQTVYRLDAMGMQGTLTEWDAPPNRHRVEMALGPLHQTQADNGQVAWQQDGTGNVRIVQGAELSEGRAEAAFSLERYDPIKSGKAGRVTLRPARETDTGDYILDVALGGGANQTLYLDPKTYLVHKIVSAKGGMAGAITIQAYKTVGGQRIPARMQIGYAGLPITVNATLTQARTLAHVDPALFALPQSAADYEFLSAPSAASVVIPFDDAGGEIVVPVTINGHTLRFLLDSGAGSSFITGQAAQTLGLTTQGMLPAVGYGGTASSGLATHATVELPGLRLTNQNLYVIKDPAVAQTLSTRVGVDGGLGYDLLNRLTTTVDYAHKTLTFTRPAAYTPPAGATSLPINLEVRVPNVTARVDGKAAGHFLVDTGDTGAIHLYTAYARANGLLGQASDPGAQVQTAAGIGGLLTQVVTPNHTLSLGATTLTHLPVATSTAQGISSFSLGAGGIGNAALSRFVVTFDYAHSRLLLQKPSADTPSLDIVPTETGPEMTTSAVLARHLEALGGKAAVSAIQNTRVTQTVETGGIHGTVTTVYKAPDKEYEQDSLGIIDTTEGYDGHTAWRKDSNGNVRLLGDDERRELRLQLFIDTNSYVLPDEGIPGKVTLRPQREAGTGDYVLDVLPTDGKPSTLFLDPKTFLIAREEHLDDNVRVVTTYRDYRSVNGVQFPYSQTTTNGAARYDVVSRVTQIANNAPVADSLFALPSAMGSRAVFLTPGASSATTTFTLDDGEISVPVSINGTASRVYLDSGASGLALSQTIADTLHLQTQGYLEARGYGGSTDLHPVKITTFDIPGAVRLSGLAAVAIALPPGFETGLSGPLAGFIGYDLLSHFVTRIDYAHNTITLTDPAKFTPTPADGHPLPLNLDNDVPSITAQFGNLPPAQFLIDTGDESALRLYGPYVDQNKLRQKYPKEMPTVGGGIGGESRSVVAKTDSFSVAGVTLRGIPTEFSLDTKGGASQILAGSLGSRLLSRFVVTFDYPHGRLFFAPNINAAKPFDTRTFGLSVISAKDQANTVHVVVVDVAPGSPAATAGVIPMDQIVQVDGQPVSALGLTRIRALLSPEGGDGPHTLILSSPLGVQRTVKVALFDPLS